MRMTAALPSQAYSYAPCIHVCLYMYTCIDILTHTHAQVRDLWAQDREIMGITTVYFLSYMIIVSLILMQVHAHGHDVYVCLCVCVSVFLYLYILALSRLFV